MQQDMVSCGYQQEVIRGKSWILYRLDCYLLFFSLYVGGKYVFMTTNQLKFHGTVRKMFSKTPEKAVPAPQVSSGLKL